MSLESPITNPPSTPPHNRYCCFHFPYFSAPSPSLGGPSSSSVSSSASSFWDRVRLAESDSTWWTRPITAFKKAREWSEIVAGPKWKTFIRRFNRNSRHGQGHGKVHGHGQFQYDPLSYALNFDDGQGQNGHFDEEGFGDNYPDFSARFVARSSVDFGQGAPAS